MTDASMERFWDARAREDAYFFVDSRLRYGAPDLDQFWQGGVDAVERMLRELEVEMEPNNVALDLGCGVGRVTRALAERAGAVKAIDVSERMLEIARSENTHLENVEWIHGDGVSLEGIPSQSVDACVELVVFQHIPDPEITFGYVVEIGRVLRPAGWAALQVSNAPAMHTARGLRSRAQSAWRSLRGRGPRGQAHPAWLGSSIDLERLAEVAEQAGMRIERVVGAGTMYCLLLLRRV